VASETEPGAGEPWLVNPSNKTKGDNHADPALVARNPDPADHSDYAFAPLTPGLFETDPMPESFFLRHGVRLYRGARLGAGARVDTEQA
jgi:hypothetical protein